MGHQLMKEKYKVGQLMFLLDRWIGAEEVGCLGFQKLEEKLLEHRVSSNKETLLLILLLRTKEFDLPQLQQFSGNKGSVFSTPIVSYRPLTENTYN